VLRRLLRRAGPALIRRHWPGPERSLAVLLRLAAGPTVLEPAPDAPAPEEFRERLHVLRSDRKE